MTLTLRAVSLNEQPLTQPITAHFDAKGGTIGRYDDNTLALPDPERHISRRQAEIFAVGAGYSIRNVGSANPITVRGQPLGRGETTTLAHPDQVRMGGYLLEVLDDQCDEEASTITRGRATVEASVPPALRATPPALRGGAAPASLGGPFDDLAPLSQSADPFADLLGPGATPSPAVSRRCDETPAPQRAMACAVETDVLADLMPPAVGIAATSSAWTPAKPAAGAAKLPDDFDPFATPYLPTPPTRPEEGDGGAFDDLIPSTRPASIDSVAPLGPGARDALADFLSDAVPTGAVDAARSAPAGAVSTDPMEALFGTAAPATPQATARDDTPALRSAYLPPSAQTPIPGRFDREAKTPHLHEQARAAAPVCQTPAAAAVREPSAPTSRPTEDGLDAHRLWTAFCEGAGVNVDLPPTPELLQAAGSLLRIAVDGTLRLMEVRRATKHELRAQVTVIHSRNNNPLKFSPDAQVALEQLLRPPVRGFLPGPAAMTDAMHDLVGHSIGTMAGTRAALEGVLDRFAPGELESKLAGKSLLDTVLPMSRKARLWDLYLDKFEAIRAEAKDDFDTLFGKAFVAAYEQQLDRLEREKSGASRDSSA